MFKRLLKDTFLQFKRFPLGSFINLTGMTIGIAIFLLIVVHLGVETGIHRDNPNRKNIVRIANSKNPNGWKGTPAILGVLLSENLPEVESFVRFDHRRNPYTIKVGDQPKKLGKVGYADSTFFRIFPQEFIYGDAYSCLEDPYSIVLTESNAMRLFGRTNLVGEMILVDNEHNCRIQGIVKDPTNLTHFDADAYISFHSMPLITKDLEMFDCHGCFNYDTYLLLSKNLDKKKIIQKINNYIQEYATLYSNENLRDKSFLLDGLKDVYFGKEAAPSYRKGNPTQLKILSAVALVILIMVLINYVNLSNAQSNSSIHELAIRRALGAEKYHLVLMKLFESLSLSIVSTGLGFILMLLLKPGFTDILGVQYPPGFSGLPGSYIYIPLGALVWGFVAGIYPAINISRLGSSQSLQLVIKDAKGRTNTRKVLTIIQLGTSILLIICTSIVFLQMKFTRVTNLGFDNDKLLYMPMNSQLTNNKEAFRQELLSHPSVENVSFSYGSYRVNSERWGLEFREGTIELHMEFVDEYYLETLGLSLIKGRNFLGEADKGNIIINEAAQKAFFKDGAIGTKIERNDSQMEIIGVVSDWHFMSFHSEVEPLAIMYKPSRIAMCNVRFNKTQQKSIVPHLAETWANFVSEFPFDYKFVTDYFNGMYQKEVKLGQLFILFSLISVFIAGLGIYGLITFLVIKRSKEVTIRKISGAQISNIIALFFRELSWMIVFASLPAFIISGFLMTKWFEGFMLHINMPILVFPAAMCLVWLITLITSTTRTLKAAKVNPAEMLRRP